MLRSSALAHVSETWWLPVSRVIQNRYKRLLWHIQAMVRLGPADLRVRDPPAMAKALWSLWSAPEESSHCRPLRFCGREQLSIKKTPKNKKQPLVCYRAQRHLHIQPRSTSDPGTEVLRHEVRWAKKQATMAYLGLGSNTSRRHE